MIAYTFLASTTKPSLVCFVAFRSIFRRQCEALSQIHCQFNCGALLFGIKSEIWYISNLYFLKFGIKSEMQIMSAGVFNHFFLDKGCNHLFEHILSMPSSGLCHSILGHREKLTAPKGFYICWLFNV